MNSISPVRTIFYLIEQSIKDYRKLSQQNIKKHISDITLDQCLVLMILHEEKSLSQKEIADLTYKDYASITRMIELMVKKNYLKRLINQSDRRRFDLKLSDKGIEALNLLTPQVKENREIALSGISKEEQMQLQNILGKIISNCKPK